MIWPEMSVKSCISPKNGGFDVRWVRSQNTSIYLNEARCPVAEGLSAPFQEFSHPD